jgi:hypothetical protein
MITDVPIFDDLGGVDAELQVTPMIYERFVDTQYINDGLLAARVDRQHEATHVSKTVQSALFLNQFFPNFFSRVFDLASSRSSASASPAPSWCV